MKAISLFLLIAACASNRPQEDDPYAFIQAPLKSLVPQMRECYTKSSLYVKNPDAEIKTKLEFEIEKDGSTSHHKVIESSLNDEKFKKCLVENLKSLKYPPQKESFIVDQAFNFYPRRP